MFFFQSLELEDLDWMLHGSETAICVDDWKAHTEYNGYKETDPQIFWFWKVRACRILNFKFMCFPLLSFFPMFTNDIFLRHILSLLEFPF